MSVNCKTKSLPILFYDVFNKIKNIKNYYNGQIIKKLKRRDFSGEKKYQLIMIICKTNSEGSIFVNFKI